MGPHTCQLPEPPNSASQISSSVKCGWMPTTQAAQVRQLMETHGGVLPPGTLFPQRHNSPLQEALRPGRKVLPHTGAQAFQR